jgi:hypothetical protein
MCAVLSQANNHKEALNHAKISALICEDNISKTFILFNQMKKTFNQDKNLNVFEEEKFKEMEKIIENLYKKIENVNRCESNALLSKTFIDDKQSIKYI